MGLQQIFQLHFRTLVPGGNRLIPLLNVRHLDALPPHIVCFCLKFNYTVLHNPGKLLIQLMPCHEHHYQRQEMDPCTKRQKPLLTALLNSPYQQPSKDQKSTMKPRSRIHGVHKSDGTVVQIGHIHNIHDCPLLESQRLFYTLQRLQQSHSCAKSIPEKKP